MNISEFRKDLSKHFNDAVQGRPVFITRAGQMFKLEAYIPPENDPYVRINFVTQEKHGEKVTPIIQKKSVGKPTRSGPQDIASAVMPSVAEDLWKEVGVRPIPAGEPDSRLPLKCCTLKNPCKHWQFNSDNQTWVNLLSGEVREVNQ